MIQEELGKEPDPDKMPLTDGDFPYEVQVAFFIYSLLSDRYEGMSGTYMGKDWGPLSALLDVYEVDDRKDVVYFLKIYESINTDLINKRMEVERKRQERKNGKKH
tara:strand:- start:18 stop:332 length:315 start_codon:yes stop_codon:yes gene_type:complete